MRKFTSSRSQFGSSLMACAATLAFGCSSGATTTTTTTTRAQTKPPSGLTYATELARVDRNLRQLALKSDRDPGDWMVRARRARAYMDRAKLSGDYRDFAAADAELDGAFRVAAKGSGPWLARAQLDYTLHRFDRVEASLAHLDTRIIRSSRLRSSLANMRADLQFQRGNYGAALARYRVAVDQEPNTATIFRLGIYEWRTGNLDGALALVHQAAASYRGSSPRQRAWFDLQLGLIELDRGRYAEALAHYRDATAEIDGWWLVDEHVAEVLAKMGKIRQAKALYELIIARTGNPEFMDALAALVRSEDPGRAERLTNRARGIYNQRLADFPEASYGHAFGHFIRANTGADSAIALQLALKNLAQRPGAPARISLAQAQLQAGNLNAAKETIVPALESPWRSAALFATAATVWQRLGEPAESKRYREQAVAINPHAMHDLPAI